MNSTREKSTIGRNRLKVIFHGFLIWTVWIVLYSIIFHMQTKLPYGQALFISANDYYIFAFLSFGIWSVCRRLPFDRIWMPLLVGIHFILSVICSVLWLVLIYGIWYLIEGKKIFEEFDFKMVVGWQLLFGIITYLVIAGINYTIIYYRQFREKELQEAHLKLLTRDAEFRALKSQINPHFLFNSLNSINALVTQNPGQARQMIAKLSELLRLSLASHEKMLVSLKEELDFAHLYLEIEKIRFSSRMVIHEQVAPNLLSFSFPAMVLQPLLENAVKHGIAGKRGKGEVSLVLDRQESFLRCVLRNTVGKGQRNQLISDGTGLGNIRQRLDLMYGEEYTLESGFTQDGQYETKLLVPVRKSV
jgi:sensor histidine kinase YesM